MHENIQIAIDGPSAAGKSYLARAVAARLAQRIDCIYADTGALYRAIGLYMARAGVSANDTEGIRSNLSGITLDLSYAGGEQKVVLNGEDVTDKLRTPLISQYASAVSAVPQVRAFLLDLQRGLADKHSVVMDGRDIGTVILPEANVKIFLTASREERAKRRYADLIGSGCETTMEEVLADIDARDHRDETRASAPLKPAKDAIPFDNSNRSRAECVDYALSLIEEKCGGKLAELSKTSGPAGSAGK